MEVSFTIERRIIFWADKLKVADFLRNIKRILLSKAPVLEQVAVRLFPTSRRLYEAETSTGICLPLFHRPDAAWLNKHIATQSAHLTRKVYIVCPVLGDGGAIEGFGLTPFVYVQIKPVATLEDFLSFTVSFEKVVLLDESNPAAWRHVQTVMQRLNLSPLATVSEAFSLVNQKIALSLSGPRSTAYPLFTQLKETIRDYHYGYKEKLHVETVKRLPDLYSELSRTTDIIARPEMSLFQGLGRAARQFGVGVLYGPKYFQGSSVLDVGCDLGGVRRSVGAKTRYYGVDMQGMPDQVVNLDTEGLPFKDKEFETVLCFEVLEHLEKIHETFDSILRIASKYVVASLYIESASNHNRITDSTGLSLGNTRLPLAPVFDRHRWVFCFTDAMNFIYYRAALQNYEVDSLQLFYAGTIERPRLAKKIQKAFSQGNVRFLNRHINLLAFALRRK